MAGAALAECVAERERDAKRILYKAQAMNGSIQEGVCDGWIDPLSGTVR